MQVARKTQRDGAVQPSRVFTTPPAKKGHVEALRALVGVDHADNNGSSGCTEQHRGALVEAEAGRTVGAQSLEVIICFEREVFSPLDGQHLHTPGPALLR
jgi:hypothetical protein